MKVLLTGATGFLGKNLMPVLSEKYETIGIGSKDFDLRFQDDCRIMLRRNNPDVVIHAAGSVGGIGANQQNPGKFLYENLIMGANLIHQAMDHNISKFVLLGTVCAYPKMTAVPFDESDLWKGYPEETNAPYGIAKKTLMKMIETYREQYNFKGVNLIPVNMYGPHDHFNLTSSHVIPALILKVYNAMKNGDRSITLWGTGQVSREFLYAPDCAQAIIKAIETDVPPSPINIGTGKEIKICDLITEIAEQMGYEGEIKYDSSKPDGQPRRCLSTIKAKELLDFEANTDLQTGLMHTIGWFLKDIKNP
jgi:nucleoside-diphosphate-sugar epimerase